MDTRGEGGSRRTCRLNGRKDPGVILRRELEGYRARTVAGAGGDEPDKLEVTATRLSDLNVEVFARRLTEVIKRGVL